MAARIVVTEFVSLDGVMEAPGGEPGFKYTGWTFEFDRGDDGNRFKLDETMQADPCWCTSGRSELRRATLTGSDSDGNLRARPSSERPLPAKAA